MKNFTLAIAAILLCSPLAFSQQLNQVIIKSPKQIPALIIQTQNHFNQINVGRNVPVAELCEQADIVREFAYPAQSAAQVYPQPSNPQSMPNRAMAQVETQYSKDWSKAEAILAQADALSAALECNLAVNDKCCRRANTRDYCDPSTTKNCELDGYNWCKGTSNAC